MRSIFTLAGLLIVMVVVLVLATRQTRRDLDAVKSVTFATQSDVRAQSFDVAAADRLAERLRDLSNQPQLPSGELHEAAQLAEGWAAGLAPGTAEYHVAVNLRGAALELMAASESLGDPHRATARRLLEQSQGSPGTAPGAPPGPIGGIRDKIQDLQQSHAQQMQDVEKEQH
ncbi:MAG TPA: hypothetical protein VMT19_00660 [Thermoanaerobaculaceae bacterium]|nr:hypothetical protein [Thermoanaerobaculaceae bacterium]